MNNSTDNKDHKDHTVKEPPAAATPDTYQKSQKAKTPWSDEAQTDTGETTTRQELVTKTELIELKSDLRAESIEMNAGLKDELTDVKIRLAKVETNMAIGDAFVGIKDEMAGVKFWLAKIEESMATKDDIAKLERNMCRMIFASAIIIIVVLGLLIKL